MICWLLRSIARVLYRTQHNITIPYLFVPNFIVLSTRHQSSSLELLNLCLRGLYACILGMLGLLAYRIIDPRKGRSRTILSRIHVNEHICEDVQATHSGWGKFRLEPDEIQRSQSSQEEYTVDVRACDSWINDFIELFIRVPVQGLVVSRFQ